MCIDKYKDIIKPMLSKSRYEHSVNVSKVAVKLAERCGANKEKAAIAGILHDILKEASIEKNHELIKKYDMHLNPIELNAKKLWHSKIGAEYIKNELNIEDEDIINAVRYHTTARAGMSILEKIIFIADFISEDRDYEGVDDIRVAAKKSIEDAMIEGLSFTISDLATRKQAIHTDTLAAYNELVLQ